MTNNTIANVPRELLDRVKSLCEYWFVRGQQQHMSESEHKTWHALGFGSSAFTELRTLLSTPSPAGVDGLSVVAVVNSDDGTTAGYGHLLQAAPDGEELCRLSDAQAIIDGLRGEVDRYRAVLDGAKYPNLDKLLSFSVEDCRFLGETVASMTISVQSERDQQAQRIGELEGLLRAESARVDFLDAYIVTAEAPDTGKVAMLADSGTLRECIDAAMSAGKDSEQ